MRRCNSCLDDLILIHGVPSLFILYRNVRGFKLLSPMIFIIMSVPNNILENLTTYSLELRGINLISLSSMFQLMKSKYFPEIWTLEMKNIFECILSMRSLIPPESTPIAFL